MSAIIIINYYYYYTVFLNASLPKFTQLVRGEDRIQARNCCPLSMLAQEDHLILLFFPLFTQSSRKYLFSAKYAPGIVSSAGNGRRKKSWLLFSYSLDI